MEPFLEKEEATTTSRLVGILPGNPPKINLVDFALGRNGVKRHFTQQVPVLDHILFARLLAEVNVGDDIRVTVINEYRETGSSVYLANFQKTSDVISGSTVQNGNRSHQPTGMAKIADRSPRNAKINA